jgi:5'-nucleotidase
MERLGLYFIASIHSIQLHHMSNRREFLIKSTMAFGAVSILRPFQSFAGMGLPKMYSNKLVLLHTANLKGQWKSLAGREKLFGLGGLENLTGKIREIRKEGAPVLLVDAGNMLGKSTRPEEQQAFYHACSRMGYDAVIPGQTDLQSGAPGYDAMARDAGLRLIGGKDQFLNTYLPYRLVNKANHQVAIIDAGKETLRRLDKTSQKSITGMINKTSLKIKEQNDCIVTICLLQENKKATEEIALNSAGVDIILTSEEVSSIFNTSILRNNQDQEVVVSFTGSRGAMINRIDLTFNEANQKQQVMARAVLIGVDEKQYVATCRRFQMLNQV